MTDGESRELLDNPMSDDRIAFTKKAAFLE